MRPCTSQRRFAPCPARSKNLPRRVLRPRARRAADSIPAGVASPLQALAQIETASSAGFRRNPVNFLLERLVWKSAALQNSHSQFNHLRVATKISGCGIASQSPLVAVLANQIFDASRLAVPFRVFPRTADRRNVGEPRNFRSDSFDFLAISKFNRSAGSVDHVEVQVRRHIVLFPILVEGSDVRNVRSNTGHGAEQQMILVAALQVEGEAAFRNLAHTDFIACVQLIELGSQRAVGNELEKNLELRLVGGRDDRISALDQAIAVGHTQRSVLTRNKIELAAGIELDLPEVMGDLVALGDAGAVELVPAERHAWSVSQDCLRT